MTFRRGLLSAVKWIRRCQGKRRESMSLRKLASVIAPATSVTVITVVRQLVAAIAEGFIVAKDNYRIRMHARCAGYRGSRKLGRVRVCAWFRVGSLGCLGAAGGAGGALSWWRSAVVTGCAWTVRGRE
jgi:hypothetical protein